MLRPTLVSLGEHNNVAKTDARQQRYGLPSCARTQALLSTPRFRCYRTTDVIGSVLSFRSCCMRLHACHTILSCRRAAVSSRHWVFNVESFRIPIAASCFVPRGNMGAALKKYDAP